LNIKYSKCHNNFSKKKKIFLQSKPGTMGSNFSFFDTLCNFFYTLAPLPRMLIENKRKIAFLISLLSPSLAPHSFFDHLDPPLCRKALALKVSPTSNGEPICSEPWFYHTSQLGSVPFLGQPAIPHVAVRRRAPLRPITHPHISTRNPDFVSISPFPS
jgi:hypothetical protein